MWSGSAALGSMENNHVLSLTPIDHPSTRVRQLDSELIDPCVERCWGAIGGATATMLRSPAPSGSAARTDVRGLPSPLHFYASCKKSRCSSSGS